MAIEKKYVNLFFKKSKLDNKPGDFLTPTHTLTQTPPKYIIKSSVKMARKNVIGKNANAVRQTMRREN